MSKTVNTLATTWVVLVPCAIGAFLIAIGITGDELSLSLVGAGLVYLCSGGAVALLQRSSDAPISDQRRYSLVVSFVVASASITSPWVSGRKRIVVGFIYTFLTLTLGWWSLTGLVSTVGALARNLAGGERPQAQPT